MLICLRANTSLPHTPGYISDPTPELEKPGKGDGKPDLAPEEWHYVPWL
jgi:hypothetical protein